MSFGPAPRKGATSPELRSRVGLASAWEVLAGGAQALVAFGTLLLGLGWGGWTYPAAVVQAVAFLLLLRPARRRHLGLLLLVPVVSAALSIGLFRAGQALGHLGA